MKDLRKTILYYHLFFEKKAVSVIDKHVEIIEKSGFDLIYIYAYNINNDNKYIFKAIHKRVSLISNATICVSSRSDVNEFATLEQISDDISRYSGNDWIAYAHSKGISHSPLSNASFKGKLLLKELMLVHNIIKNNSVFADYYDVAGSDLVMANFNDFGPPQTAFAGNMWMAKACHIRKLIKIHPNMKDIKSVRYHAEAWIGSHYSSKIFNVFSPARHHYDEHWRDVNEFKISKELYDFTVQNSEYNVVQSYFNEVLSCTYKKMEKLYIEFYPYSIRIRRVVFDFIQKNFIENKLLYKISMSFFYRSGLLRSPLGLFYIDIPSQLTLEKVIHTELS